MSGPIWLVLISAMAQAPTGATSVDATARARTFLEAFAADPATARKFATKDAGVVIGDIGGPYDEFVKVIQSQAPEFLKTCRVGELQEKPGPTADELEDAPPRYHGGKIAIVEGAYNCARADGAKRDVEFIVVLKNDQIVELHLGGAR